MLHLVEDEDFVQLKQRWLTTSPNGIDARIVNSINRFNRVNGVVTVFSCSGHTETELINNPNLDLSPECQVIFVTNEEGQEFVKSYLEWLQTLSVETWLDLRPKLSYLKLAWPLRVKGPKVKLYNAYELTFAYYRERHSDDHASKAIDSLLDYHFKKK